MHDKHVVAGIFLGLLIIVLLGVLAFAAGGNSRVATYALYVVGSAYMVVCFVIACRRFARCVSIYRRRGHNH